MRMEGGSRIDDTRHKRIIYIYLNRGGGGARHDKAKGGVNSRNEMKREEDRNLMKKGERGEVFYFGLLVAA